MSINCIECGTPLSWDDISLEAETCLSCWRQWYFGEPPIIAAARAVLYGGDDTLPHGWPLDPELIRAYADLGYPINT